MNPLHDPDNYRLGSGGHFSLGCLMLMWLFDRLQCGIWGPNPLPGRSLIDAVQRIDPGYCLDAPGAMPAGGMNNFQVPPDPDDEQPMWLSEQLLCEREGE